MHPKCKETWQRSFSNELGCLAEGIRETEGTNATFFMPKDKVPKHRKVSHGRMTCDIHPQKVEMERTWLTVGGDCLTHNGPKTMETADVTTVKVLINSTASTEGVF